MVIEIKHKNKILNIKLENKIEKEIVTMLSSRLDIWTKRYAKNTN